MELFRIILMLLIIAHHYVVNSGLTAASGPIYASPLSCRSLFLLAAGGWGKIAINGYVLITGYFMCTSKISGRKFLRLVLEVAFYKLLFYVIFLIIGYTHFSIKELLLSIIPVTEVKGNFIGCYLVFYLTIPFLNVLIHNLNKKQHGFLLLFCGFVYVALGTLHRVNMNYLTWFIVLYLIGSYIRLYPKAIYKNIKLWSFITVFLVLADILSIIGLTWLGQRMGKNMSYWLVSDANAILAVLTGISSFILFSQLPVKRSKAINWIASSTFGVLLVHANSDLMRQWLWKDTLNNVGWYSSKWMPLHLFLSVIIIFIIATMIDKIRIAMIEKPLMNRIDSRWPVWMNKMHSNKYTQKLLH